MTTVNEGALKFTFDTHCEATKYDEWSFYRNQFQNACGGSKAADFLCIDGNFSWIIEVKDYRYNRRTKPSDIDSEVSQKVRDTLAGLAAAGANANDPEEKSMAMKAFRSRKWRIVLHLEQPQKHSKLFPRIVNPSNLVTKLKQKLKAVDPHPLVVDKHSLHPTMCWKVA